MDTSREPMKLESLMRIIPYGTSTRIRIEERLTDKKGLYLGTREVYCGRADNYLLADDRAALDKTDVTSMYVSVIDGELNITVEDKTRCLTI